MFQISSKNSFTTSTTGVDVINKFDSRITIQLRKMNSDWPKLVTMLATSNRSASFDSIVVALL